MKPEQEKLKYLKRKEENRKKREATLEEKKEKKVDEDDAFFQSILPHVRGLDAKQKMNFEFRCYRG